MKYDAYSFEAITDYIFLFKDLNNPNMPIFSVLKEGVNSIKTARADIRIPEEYLDRLIDSYLVEFSALDIEDADLETLNYLSFPEHHPGFFIRELKTTIETLNNRIIFLEKELSEKGMIMQIEVGNVTRNMESMTQEFEESKKQILLLKEDLSQKDLIKQIEVGNITRNMESMAQEFKSVNEALSKEIMGLQTQKLDSETNIKNLENAKDELRKMNQSLSDEIKKLHSEIEDQKGIIRKLIVNAEEIAHQRRETAQKCTDLQTENLSLRAQIAHLEQRPPVMIIPVHQPQNPPPSFDHNNPYQGPRRF